MIQRLHFDQLTFPAMTSLRPKKTALVRSKLFGIFLVVALLHLVAWTTLIVGIAPLQPLASGQALGLGIGVTAYTLGVRHAFDADHIAAIDNTTRKLLGQRMSALTVGFWFSLGHSSVVLGVSLVAAAGFRLFAGSALRPGSMFGAIGGTVGPIISSGFLYLIATFNAVAFLNIWKARRRYRASDLSGSSSDDAPRCGGLLYRLLRPVSKCVTKPRHMFLVGLLFGLGFDTATEIAFLVLSASPASRALPWYLQLCFPLLFAAGMVLFDSMDGIFMNSAYSWAACNARRRVYYNLVVTWLSVIVAFLVATFEVAAALREHSWFTLWLPEWLDRVDLELAGVLIVFLFSLVFVIALVLRAYGKAEVEW